MYHKCLLQYSCQIRTLRIVSRGTDAVDIMAIERYYGNFHNNITVLQAQQEIITTHKTTAIEQGKKV